MIDITGEELEWEMNSKNFDYRLPASPSWVPTTRLGLTTRAVTALIQKPGNYSPFTKICNEYKPNPERMALKFAIRHEYPYCMRLDSVRRIILYDLYH